MTNQGLTNIFTAVAMLLALGLGAFNFYLLASSDRARAALSKLREENKRLREELAENKTVNKGKLLRERNKLKGEKGKLAIALKRSTERIKRLQKQKDNLAKQLHEKRKG